MPGEILSVDDVGRLIGLSTSAVWRLLQQGDLPGAKIGGQWRVRREDLDRHFDLARAQTQAQSRQKAAEQEWGPIVERLAKAYETPMIVTRCLWCPEFVPAAEGFRYTTLCSRECAAELRHAFGRLGWPIDYLLELSPINDWLPGDYEFWIRMSLGEPPVNLMVAGAGPDEAAVRPRWKMRHERGPLRELLLLEHPLLHDRVARPATEAVQPRRPPAAKQAVQRNQAVRANEGSGEVPSDEDGPAHDRRPRPEAPDA